MIFQLNVFDQQMLDKFFKQDFKNKTSILDLKIVYLYEEKIFIKFFNL